jgi:hypothetical protein
MEPHVKVLQEFQDRFMLNKCYLLDNNPIKGMVKLALSSLKKRGFQST